MHFFFYAVGFDAEIHQIDPLNLRHVISVDGNSKKRLDFGIIWENCLSSDKNGLHRVVASQKEWFWWRWREEWATQREEIRLTLLLDVPSNEDVCSWEIAVLGVV